MIENPFAEPDDDDRTVVRPFARPAPVPEATAAAQADATIVAAPVRPLRADPKVRKQLPNVALSIATEAPLAAAAAPLIQLLARLRNTLTPPDSGDLRERAAAALRVLERDARTANVPADLLRIAHYALCASLDDVVLNTPWGSQGAWVSRSLVSTFHNEVRGGERFFDLLKDALASPARFLPVLEIMYACLSLGFMGRYRLSPRGPAEVDRLREELYAAIVGIRPVTDVELSGAWRGVDAPYRPTARRVPFWIAGTAGLAILGSVFVWFSLDLNRASDAAYEAALRTPPVTMPDIMRAGPAVPPTPAPEAEPGALDRLKTFLKPEIDAGLVEVLGTESAPIIRLHGTGTFNPGSATPLQGAVPVLQRIGAALKDEPGPVQIFGYTDNEPIRTVRFPSNFQLSTARADAARAILAETIEDASRLSAEGRADADPIASNATPQGRAANRRIEIVLHRQG